MRLCHLTNSLRNLRSDAKGVSAIEFAILAPVFFALLFSVFEMGILYTRMVLLDDTLTKTSKLIYIGTFSEGLGDGTLTASDFEKSICDKVSILFPSCEANLTIELTPVNTFSDVPSADAVCHDKDATIKPAVDFDPGGGSTIVFMRACMTVSILTPGFGLGLALPKTDNDRYQLISSTTFMNEPF